VAEATRTNEGQQNETRNRQFCHVHARREGSTQKDESHHWQLHSVPLGDSHTTTQHTSSTTQCAPAPWRTPVCG
jgi:hypothetical protein